MQLRNVRHVAGIIKTETSIYRLIRCVQIRMIYFYAVCDFSFRIAKYTKPKHVAMVHVR